MDGNGRFASVTPCALRLAQGERTMQNVAEKLGFQATQKDLRGEAIERNEAYESFSGAC